MSNQIYRKKAFIIITVSRGYIVINTNKPFEEGHTHIKNFNMAKKLIYWSIKRTIPSYCSNYILTSLIRLSEDNIYKDKLKLLILNKRSRMVNKPKYINGGKKIG